MHKPRRDWAEIASMWEQSGELQQIFASRHGVPVETLRSWIYRRRREQKPPRAKFVEVRVASPGASTAPVELTLPSGASLRIAPGTDPTWAAAFVKLLLA